MLGEAHPYAAAMVQGNPGRATGGIQQRVQQRPVGYRVGTVLHRFGFAVRAGNGTGVKVIAADHYRRRQLAAADHFVKRQAQTGALPQSDPADAGR